MFKWDTLVCDFSLSLSGGLTPSCHLRPSSGRGVDFMDITMGNIPYTWYFDIVSRVGRQAVKSLIIARIYP